VRASGAGLFGAFAATFGLTLANPATILSFVAVFAGLGIAGAGGWREATVLVGGVFLGSVLSWLMLTKPSAPCAPASIRPRSGGSTDCRGSCSRYSGGGGVGLAMTPIVGRSGG
jgi:threonine/homoserine/homoserine lactone efflux protein